jgi:NAD(P)H-dependent flavin oxidoreductase YrpB (nitropropane dioxygenase family)
MARAALRTALCERLGIEHPIVQTGMGWVAGARLTSATANAGGLGILASATMTLPELARAIAETRTRTERPFGVNLRGDAPDGPERVALLIRERVAVVSFAALPNERLIKSCKDAGLFAIQSVGARRHAEKVAAFGVDAVIAQGAEAGGHVGSVPTSVLLPQVVDAVGIPVVAAGGFFDGRGLVAALAFGAAGIAMGTRFLLTAESPVPSATAERYLAAGLGDVVVTSEIDGLPQRVIVNELLRELEGAGPLAKLWLALRSAFELRAATGASPLALARTALALRRNERLTRAQIVMAANAPILAKRAMQDGDPVRGYLPSGTVTGLIEDRPTCAALVERILREAEETLKRLSLGTSA